jgi:inhibitor of KinA sporulation pathway (predicted exonuclease)
VYELVVDVESTCWSNDEDKTLHYKDSEIIEIGFAVVDSGTRELLSSSGIMVRPVRVPILSEFCKNLTSIRQDMVDSGLEFQWAIGRLSLYLGATFAANLSGMTMCSWGDYDRNMFKIECKRRGMTYPFGRHMMEALEIAGLDPMGVHHRGTSDAMNIARLYHYLKERSIDETYTKEG